MTRASFLFYVRSPRLDVCRFCAMYAMHVCNQPPPKLAWLPSTVHCCYSEVAWTYVRISMKLPAVHYHGAQRRVFKETWLPDPVRFLVDGRALVVSEIEQTSRLPASILWHQMLRTSAAVRSRALACSQRCASFHQVPRV